MPSPDRSFGRAFSRLGRLENAWARALAEPDPHRALDRLRELYPRFENLGTETAGLWLSFQESVLDPRFVPLLADADFDRLRERSRQLDVDGVIGLAQSWGPLIQVCLGRGFSGDQERACSLLTDLYYAPSVPSEIRTQAAVTLAGLTATGQAQLAVYADVMVRHPWPPPEVARLVLWLLNVGFDSADERLVQAYELAAKLGTAGRADVAFALGLGELLGHQRPAVAVQHFAAAIEYGATDGEALRGLFSAYLHARDFAAVVAIGIRTARLSPRCADLLTACQALAWFEVCAPTADSLLGSVTPPVTAAQLAGIAPGRDLGPWRDYALGRRHLLDGDAAKAKDLLMNLPGAGLPDLDVRYHLAWAHLLCQDPDGVRADYDALAGRPGSWALACVFQDASPGQPPPEPAPYVPEPLSQIAAVRQELAGEGVIPAETVVEPPAVPGLTQPELFEILRTALGVAVTQGRFDQLKTLLRQPLFARLPAAERLLWSALAVRASDPERCRLALRQSLDLGRDRAALLLAVDALDDGRVGEVHGLLHGVRGPKAELLRAWSDAHSGRTPDAVTRFERLSRHGLAPADYALALLALRDAAQASALGDPDEARRQAVRAQSQLSYVATRSRGRFHRTHLEPAAQALASAHDVPNGLEPAAQPWAARLIGLVQVIRAPESVDVVLLKALPKWMGLDAEITVGSPRFPAGVALSQAVLRVVLLTEDAAARQAAGDLLIWLAERFPGEDTSRAARRAAACIQVRAGGESDDPLAAPPDDSLVALVGAGEILTGSGPGPEQTAQWLRTVPTGGDQKADALVTLFATALDGKPLPEPLPIQAPPRVTAALAAAMAAGQAATNPQAAADTLLLTLGAHDMNGLTDLKRVLPHVALSAAAAKGGRRDTALSLLTPIARRAAEDAEKPGGVGALAAARYATVAGDHETAGRCWQRALEQPPTDADQLDEVHREYGRFLCRRAALADDQADALTLMRAGTGYLSDDAGRILADLEDDESVTALLRFLFAGSPILDRQRPGRFPRLAELIATDPGLRRGLADGQRRGVTGEWQRAAGHSGDIELWHILAVLAREDALARADADQGAIGARITATALWMLLLAEPALKPYFEQLSPADQADPLLRTHIVKELLADQKVRLTQAVARADLDAARLHAHCLSAVRQGLAATRRLLENSPFAMVARQMGTEEEFTAIADRAEGLIQEWGAERVTEAERKLRDPVAIRERAKTFAGLDADYESAISELETAIAVGLPLKNVLRVAIDWHNRWLRCARDMKQSAQAGAIIRSAEPYVDLLAPQCEQGRAHLAENQTLAEYFLVRGLTVLDDDPEESIDMVKESLAWDPTMDIAESLLEQAHVRLAESYFDRGDLAGAERIADAVPGGRQQLAIIVNNRGVEYQAQADKQLEKLFGGPALPAAADLTRLVKTLDDAESLLIQAGRLDPGASAIRTNLDQLRSLKKTLPKLFNNRGMEALDKVTDVVVRLIESRRPLTGTARTQVSKGLSEAEQLLVQAQRLDPGNPAITSNLTEVRKLKARLNLR